jgi:signal transduction histidine kinase
MSDTVLAKISRLLVPAWVASAMVGIALMYALPGAETIPFHLVWIGMSLIYGFTQWRPYAMVLSMAAVALSTGYVLAHHADLGEIGWEETAEVPLMSAIFAVMVWHVHRRQRAMAQLGRMAEASQRRAERQQLLVRLASHELRTPITIARGYAEMVLNGAGEQAAADLTIVIEELDKMARISGRLVTLMQVDAAARVTAADLDAELARIVRRWEPAAPRTWAVHSRIGVVAVNEERLETALDCLLENAVKFTAPGDRITVAGRVEQGTWVIEVADSGAGLTKELADALTSATEPVPHATTATGSGLGLAIARAVVETWGGVLQVCGKPGCGTTVTLRIPLTGHRPDDGVTGPQARLAPL